MPCLAHAPRALPFPLVLLLLALLPLAACGGADTPDLPGVTDGIAVFDDVPYRSGDTDAFLLDLAYPLADAELPRPAIVIIHGGGWRAGSKQDAVYRKHLVDWAHQGYVTVSVEYRLDQEEPFPASVADVRCAVRWVRAHAEELGIDPERIGTYGHSAGAHLSLMVGVMPDSVEAIEGYDCDWDVSAQVAAAAAGAPPTTMGGRREGVWADDTFWPVGYVRADVPPLFLIAGTDDPVVLVELVDAYVEAITEAGADVEYLRVDGAQHGVAYDQALGTTQPALDALFAEHLKGETHEER